MAEDFDTLGDTHLLIDAGCEQSFIVLYAGLGNKGKRNEDEK